MSYQKKMTKQKINIIAEEQHIKLLPHTGGYNVMNDEEFWAMPFNLIFDIKIKQSEFIQYDNQCYIAPVTIKNQQCYLSLLPTDFRRVFGLSKRKHSVKYGLGYLQTFKTYEDRRCKEKFFNFLTTNGVCCEVLRVKIFGSDEDSGCYEYQLAKIKFYLNKCLQTSMDVAKYTCDYLGMKEFESVKDLKSNEVHE